MSEKPEKVMIPLPDNLAELSDVELEALAEDIYRQLMGNGST